jgi:diguanylate cyclase (GGDEF)-like protein
VSTGTAERRLFSGYLIASLTAVVVHGFLPAGARAVSFFLIALCTVPAMCYGVRHQAPAGKPSARLLVAALVTLSVGNFSSIVGTFGPPVFGPVAELVITLGHIVALASALFIVRLRGRNDVGGLIDVAVVSMALGGLLWTAVLQPRLAGAGTGMGTQASLLINMLVLTGVLGALLRLSQTAREPILALRFIVVALVMSLAANVVLAMTTGFLTVGRPALVEVVFLVSYTFLGAIGLHPSLLLLIQPGAAPAERLSPARLTFLGAALALGPVAGAGRQALGLPVDGLLLAAGTIATVPLVMIRMGHLTAQRFRAEKELVRRATHDALTGLTNRVDLLHRLDDALARRAAGGRLDVLVLFCDLDGFKAVNDERGHAVGDELLVAVGRRLARAVAKEDVLARYGGDEFLIVCETANPVAAKTSVARRVAAALADPFDLAGEPIVIGVSIGAAVAEVGATADSVISQADAAMYQAKRHRHPRYLRSA